MLSEREEWRKGAYKDKREDHVEKEHVIGLYIFLAVIWHQLIEVLVNTAHTPCVYAIFALWD